MKTSWFSYFTFFCLLTSALSAQDWQIGGRLEHTVWASGDVPAGFLEFDNNVLFEPSLTLDFAYQPSDKFYFNAVFNLDRGFDPGASPDGDFRLDNLVLRYRPFGNNSLNFQLGKFATTVGNWVPEYDDNPFLLAPLPYASITGANSQNIDQLSAAQIENRTNRSTPTIHNTPQDWSAIIWGPAYAQGAAVFGSINKLDYGLEIKNAAIGSAPDERRFGEGDFNDPIISGRFGYRQDASLAYGLSFSRGPFVDSDAILSSGVDRNDLIQTLIGVDVRWAHRNWILSGEAFFSHFQRPDEDFKVFSYYLQARYKIAPGVWLAGRFGQTLSNEVPIPSGGQAPWSPDLLRGELALGWRVSPDFILKTQYTYTDVTNNFSTPSPGLFGISATWDF